MKSPLSHIVFLTPGFAGSEADSTTIPALQDYVKFLSESVPETRITIITFQFPFTSKSYHWHNIEIIPLNGQNGKLRKPFVWLKAWKTLQQINNANRISMIHSFWIGECSFIGQWWAKKFGIKHFITAMGQDVFKNKYAHFIRQNHSKIITLAKPHQALLQKNYRLSSEIIPWSINPNAFPDLKEDSLDVLGVGSLNLVKNYPAFIRVVKAVVAKYPNLKVEIIGDGAELHCLQKSITQNDLVSNITLTGKLDRTEVYDKMSRAKILLHTSHYESFGYVFAEALYSGMRIVSFAVGAAKSIPQWKIVTTEFEMTDAVIAFLNEDNSKSRMLLSTKKETVNAYLKLYHA